MRLLKDRAHRPPQSPAVATLHSLRSNRSALFRAFVPLFSSMQVEPIKQGLFSFPEWRLRLTGFRNLVMRDAAPACSHRANDCLYPRCAGPIPAHDSMGRSAREVEALRTALQHPFWTPRRTIQKSYYKSNTCLEVPIALACYLCNTVLKTVCVKRFEAVPFLCVQTASVIVTVRRRGASRGRPVLGGSLKSLAFLRECPKARSG
jgi:hypothetical protein